MKQNKTYMVGIIILIVLLVPTLVLAIWWNPFSWNWNSFNILGHQQKPVACTQEAKVCPNGSFVGRTGPNCEFAPCSVKECVTSRNCQDLHKNCYYACSNSKCVQIQTFIALKPYPDCSSAIPACVPNWTCGWGPCKNGYQGMTAVDSNSCGLPNTNVNIVCTALARECTPK